MKITLQVHGRKMTFSKEELTTIVEKYFPRQTTQQVSTAKVVQKPTEDSWFEVNPQAIDQKLFENERENKREERTRKLIIEAFFEMKSNPEKYGRNFKTMFPKKTWNYKTIGELKELACKLGSHNADWVEQALEWAQRIANGESWKTICNSVDTANWYRLVVSEKGYFWLVGGSFQTDWRLSATDVALNYDFYDSDRIKNTVPLVVTYK